MFLQGVQQVLDMNFSILQKLVKPNLNKSETESGYEIWNWEAKIESESETESKTKPESEI